MLYVFHHVLREGCNGLGHAQKRETQVEGRCKTLSHRDCSRTGTIELREALKERDTMLCLIFVCFHLKGSLEVITCLCRHSGQIQGTSGRKALKDGMGAPGVVGSLPCLRWVVR